MDIKGSWLIVGFPLVETIAKASSAINSKKARLSSKWKGTQIQNDMHNGNAKKMLKT